MTSYAANHINNHELRNRVVVAAMLMIPEMACASVRQFLTTHFKKATTISQVQSFLMSMDIYVERRTFSIVIIKSDTKCIYGNYFHHTIK